MDAVGILQPHLAATGLTNDKTSSGGGASTRELAPGFEIVDLAGGLYRGKAGPCRMSASLIGHLGEALF